MTESLSASTASQPKRHRWLRWLLWTVGTLVVLAVVAYFVATSSAFFTGVILPRVSTAIHADVTASSASIHPFKQVILRDLKVQAKGQAPLVTAPEVRLSYHLLDILGGKINVDEIALVSPTVQLVENPDGSDNLSPILNALKSQPAAAKPAAAKSAQPLQIDLRKLTLSNVTLLKIKNYAGGQRDLVAVTNLNLTLANVKNGQTGTLELSATARVENNPPAPGTNGLLAAALKGSFNFALTSDLKPGAVKGELHLNIAEAAGAFSAFAELGAALNCDVTPTDIKALALQFNRGDATLGELRVSGPFDATTLEGRLNVDLAHLDKQVLNLAGTASGLDFGPTTISATNQIQLSKGGATIVATGGLNMDQLQLTRLAQTTPTLDLHVGYDVTVDRTAQTIVLRQLTLTGTQNGQPLLNAQLTEPMNLAWGNANNAMGGSSFDLAVTHLNLADWKSFTGALAPTGDVGLKLKVTTQAGGKQIGFDLSSDITGLATRVGSNEISQADISLTARGQATDMKLVSLEKYQLKVDLQKQSALDVSGSGTYNLADGSADFQVKLQAALARLLQALPQPGMSLADGDLELTTHLMQKAQTQTVSGDLTLTNFTGQIGKNDLRNFASTVSFEVSNSPAQLLIRKLAGSLSRDGQTGGAFEISGAYQTAQKSAAVKLTLAGVNENTLAPFLQPLLADKKLVSVEINADLSAQYDPQGASSVKGGLQVTNLVVNDPQQKFPTNAQSVQLQVDASLQKQALDLRQLQLTLAPTDRAKNQVQLQGQVDFSQTTNLQGNLKLTADSLDVTAYYDLFAGKAKAASTPRATPAANAPAPAAGTANQEPAPVILPFHNFTASAAIGQFYLHEVAITNLLATLNLNGGRVQLKPFQLVLNGAPVSATADLNLGVPGWTYDVSFDARGIPVVPLANSFMADANGKYNGLIFAHAQVKGQGVTGVNLKQNLAGQVSLNLTNANIQLMASQTKIFFIPINIQFIATLLNLPEITQSPLSGVNVQINLGNGQIDTRQAEVVSPAFMGNVHGVIPIADVLTNSPLNLPVEVSLTNALATKLALSTSTSNNGYVQLPVFLTLVGTIGNPQPKENRLVLATLTASAATGLISGVVGGQATNVLKTGSGVMQGLTGLLGGHSTTGTNQTTTTNAPAKFNPFNLLK